MAAVNRAWQINIDTGGTFTDSGQALNNLRSGDIGLGDLDGDGDLDAAYGNSLNDANTTWLNT